MSNMVRIQDVKEKIRDEADKADDDEFFLIYNPRDTRTAHIMRDSVSTKSACKSFDAPPIRLDGKVDELTEIIDKDEAEDYHPVCGNCLHNVDLP